MSRILIKTGVNEMMVAPLTRFLRTPALAFWGIGVILMVRFFVLSGLHLVVCAHRSCPAPAVAVRVGLPALGAAGRPASSVTGIRIIWGLYNPRSTEING